MLSNRTSRSFRSFQEPSLAATYSTKASFQRRARFFGSALVDMESASTRAGSAWSGHADPARLRSSRDRGRNLRIGIHREVRRLDAAEGYTGSVCQVIASDSHYGAD